MRKNEKMIEIYSRKSRFTGKDESIGNQVELCRDYVQNFRERNTSMSCCKPRNNEALLTGLLFRACGEQMYPKLSKRTTTAGEPVCTYVCKMKEHSHKEGCDRRNALDCAPRAAYRESDGA